MNDKGRVKCREERGSSYKACDINLIQEYCKFARNDKPRCRDTTIEETTNEDLIHQQNHYC